MKHPLFNKILVISALTLILVVPLMMIEGIVKERSAYRSQARQDIAGSWTGEQKIIGPLLIVPFKESYNVSVWDKKSERSFEKTETRNRTLIIAPENLKIGGEIVTESRKRGIYEVPVYSSDLEIAGNYSPKKISDLIKNSKHDIELQDAYLSVVISDVRGVEVQPQLNWNGEKIEFIPDALLENIHQGMHVSLGKVVDQKGSFDFSFKLKLNGMEVLQFTPVGKNTSVKIKADWPDPSFIGRYLPSSRKLGVDGFTSTWNLSSFSSDLPQYISVCQEGQCSGLMNDSFGVKLFNSVDIYQQSERSVKYALMFIVLTFVSFFLYELMKGLRLHPMQYLLVGLGLTIFYLLLISLSEHMAFIYAYTVATIASTFLVGFYISSILTSAKHGAVITTALLVLYGMLYGILTSEDNSLLMGSLLMFSVLSLVMIMTRKIDWYAITENVTAKIGGRVEPEELL